MSKAIVFFADGTEECEALLAVDLLRRGKVEVVTASASGNRDIVSSHGVSIRTDALAEDVDYADAEMLVLPGGFPGTPNLEKNETVRAQTAAFLRGGKKVGAICATPGILGRMGLLHGRRATAFASCRDQLAGAEVLDQEVVVDGNLITSFGLGGALPFGLALVRELVGPDEAERIRSAIEYLH